MQTTKIIHKKPNYLLRTFFSDKRHSIFLQRSLFNNITGFLGKTPKKAKISTRKIAGVKARIIEGFEAEDRRTLFYLHGGAFMMGSSKTHLPLACVYSRLSRAKGIVIDYRLAPEHPFPAGLDDAVRVYEKLVSNAPSEKIALAGDSAGGGLALSLMHVLRDRGLPLPCGLYLLSPWTDLTQCNKSGEFVNKGEKQVFDYYLKYLQKMYICGKDPKNPYISPGLGDFSGFPPMLIQAATGELLRNDAKETAKRAESSGVDVKLNMYKSKVHVLQGLAAKSELGKELVKEGGKFLKDCFEG